MKNIVGDSGGGEDKRLKKNCEYVLIYAKHYDMMPIFNGAYVYTELSELIQKYISDGISWKYTSVLYDEGEKSTSVAQLMVMATILKFSNARML